MYSHLEFGHQAQFEETGNNCLLFMFSETAPGLGLFGEQNQKCEVTVFFCFFP